MEMVKTTVQTIEQINEDEQAIKEFLLDINCLDRLDQWTVQFNIFDILKISQMEIRHSNMLAYLFDPNETHGMDARMLEALIQHLVQNNSNLDVFRALLMDFQSFTILREWKNIDLLFLSNKEKFLICIENKIGSDEHDNQLDRYKDLVASIYPEYQKIFLYLTPNGAGSSDPEWESIGYEAILSMIEKSARKVELLDDVKLLVNNYLNILRRDIVGDEELKEICREIYSRHRKALDLIYENIPEPYEKMGVIIQNWCRDKGQKGEIQLDADFETNYPRFMTEKLNEFVPYLAEKNGGFKTEFPYVYWFEYSEKYFRLVLEFSSQGLSDDERKVCEKVINALGKKSIRSNWQWCRVKNWGQYNFPNIADEDLEEYVIEQLDKMLEEIHLFENKFWDNIKMIKD